MSLVGALVPSRLCTALVLWLGLGRKPEERPEVDEGERDGAALLLGVLRGLLEMEQPRAASWGEGEELWDSWGGLTADDDCLFTSLLPPVVSSFLAGVSFAGGVLALGRFSGLRLTFSTWGQPKRTFKQCFYVDCRTNRKWSYSPAYSPPATTPLQTWLALCPLYLGKGLHETPGLNAGRCTCAIQNTKAGMCRTSHSQGVDLLSHLARNLIADRNNAVVGQL